MKPTRFLSQILSCALGALALSSAALAADYPDKPLRWVVPYAAGGGSDFLARTISQGLGPRFKHPIVIDNKPGGNTAIGASDVARAAPDGYTVLSADNGTLVFNPALYSKLSYKVEDLKPVTLLGRFPMILVVGPGSKANTVQAFIAEAKAAKDGLSYGSAGAGSPHHLAMELLKVEAGLSMVHVPYRGAAPALSDVAGGQIPATMVDLAAGAGFIQSGKVRALAVANPTRLPQLPDVPTFAELGMPAVEAAALVGMVAPAGTPDEVVAQLNKLVVDSVNDADVNKRMVDFGIEPVGNSPAEYAELLEHERTRWHKLISDLNIKLD